MRITKTLGAIAIGSLTLGMVSCGESAADKPVALVDIEAAMWDSMESAESVKVTVELPDTDGAGDTAQAEAMTEMFGADFEEMSVYGAMDSSSTAVAMKATDQSEEIMRIFGDTVYMSTQFLLSNVESQTGLRDGDAEEVFSALETEYNGTWLNMPPGAAGTDGMTPAELIADLRAGWDAEGEGADDEPVAGPMDASNLTAEGQPEEREGTDVWVFSGADSDAELVVVADLEAPRILSARDGEVAMHFSEWDSAELPEEPAQDEIADENELNEAMMELY